MPIYEFYCKDCRREFKTLRSLNRIQEVTCPTCHSEKVTRFLSVTATARSNGTGEAACAMPMGGG